MEYIEKQMLWCSNPDRREEGKGLVRCIGQACERWENEKWYRCCMIIPTIKGRMVSFNPDSPYDVVPTS